MSINSNSKIFNSRTIEFYSMERGGGETREDRCSGETKTPAIISYPFTRNLSPFHTERAFTVKPQQTFIPERQYDRHFKDSALQRTIQHLFNFRYLHDFALCSSADTFLYSDNAFFLSLSHTFFSLPLGWEETGGGWNIRLQYLLCIFSRDHVMSPIICSMLGK